jgi:hypothetical protein
MILSVDRKKGGAPICREGITSPGDAVFFMNPVPRGIFLH